MNADQYGDHVAEPGDEAIRSAFASYREEAAANFPPPPVDDLIMSGPAALRRRRLVSLAAVAGACTVVTAGGFAVAQTLGSMPERTEPEDPPPVVNGSTSQDPSEGTQLGDPAPPETEPAPGGDEDDGSGDEGETLTIVIDDWSQVCEGGSFEVDQDLEFTGEPDWAIEQAVVADVDGDDASDTVMALTCQDATAVAAFTGSEAGLEHLAWVWRPDGSQELEEIAGTDGGVVTLQGLSDASETWTASFEWDGEAFVEIDDEPSTEPSPSEDSETPEPDETQTTETAPSSETRD
ncbi:hypothetical protein [Glycomyces xiaoerkulensis]|uniref:hypothetical protein n=1 Tax=Glycomyces xiaoerkulensis TaxID=2038139 RepID=UPI000C26B5BB|nr:hypothetical protein [Glycomyces xiaoerkulensis]